MRGDVVIETERRRVDTLGIFRVSPVAIVKNEICKSVPKDLFSGYFWPGR